MVDQMEVEEREIRLEESQEQKKIIQLQRKKKIKFLLTINKFFQFNE